jgi:hypothetical protein
MLLIEEKIGFGFALVYQDNFCARCVNVAPFARNVSRQGRNGTATFATPPYNHSGPSFKNIRDHYNFPEINSSDTIFNFSL